MSVLACVFFWALSFVLCELLLAQRLVDTLTYALLTVVALGLFLLNTDLDLMGALVLLTYISVFLLLNLLVLHFSSYTGRTAAREGGLPVRGFFWAFVLFGFWNLRVDVVEPVQALHWLNLILDLSWGQLSTTILHWFFYRLFILETVVLNFFLFGVLALCLGVLLFTQMTGAWGFVQSASKQRGGEYATIVRVNQVAKFRRQTRRKNAGLTRQR